MCKTIVNALLLIDSFFKRYQCSYRHNTHHNVRSETAPQSPIEIYLNLSIRTFQGRSDGGYIGIYTPKISLPYKFLCGYWLFFLFDPGQIVDFEIGMTS